jgi:hypothetical protein
LPRRLAFNIKIGSRFVAFRAAGRRQDRAPRNFQRLEQNMWKRLCHNFCEDRNARVIVLNSLQVREI